MWVLGPISHYLMPYDHYDKIIQPSFQTIILKWTSGNSTIETYKKKSPLNIQVELSKTNQLKRSMLYKDPVLGGFDPLLGFLAFGAAWRIRRSPCLRYSKHIMPKRWLLYETLRLNLERFSDICSKRMFEYCYSRYCSKNHPYFSTLYSQLYTFAL